MAEIQQGRRRLETATATYPVWPENEIDIIIDPDTRTLWCSGVEPVAFYDYGINPWTIADMDPEGTVQAPVLGTLRHYTTFGFNYSNNTIYMKLFRTTLYKPSSPPGWLVRGGELLAVFPVGAGASFNFDMQIDSQDGYGFRWAAYLAADLNAGASMGGGWYDDSLLGWYEQLTTGGTNFPTPYTSFFLSSLTVGGTNIVRT